ncbi:MAG: DUF1501 domain-containing protein [Planctomycetes bacterium]|nr:DUF1501 domain-containing protein [Planctomycetota bacterium]
MSLSRRKFLATGVASAAVISGTTQIPELLLQAAAAPSAGGARSENVLVVLQLSGGNDGLNTVVPYADDVYARNRFQTRISAAQAHKLNDYLGLHPSMAGMHRLFQEDLLTIIQGVGYANPNRSHFESMDIWHTAQPKAKRDARQVGWLGNYLDSVNSKHPAYAKNDVPAVHLGNEVQPLALAGLHVQVPSIGSFDDFRFDEVNNRQLAAARDKLLSAAATDVNELVAHVRAAAQTALASSRRVRNAIARQTNSADYPQTNLGKKLRGIAQLIQAGLSTRIYYVTLDGFDTHSLQTESHAGLLRELSGAVTAFIDDLTHTGQSDRVLLACFSEFGRRVKENASRGTDHGAAAPMFLASGRLRGGLVGEHPSLTDLDDGDLKFHTDFRRVYASLLEQWLGVPSAPLLGGTFKQCRNPKVELDRLLALGKSARTK